MRVVNREENKIRQTIHFSCKLMKRYNIPERIQTIKMAN